jgi:hypothetical protein
VFDAIDDDRSGTIDEEELMEGVSAALCFTVFYRVLRFNCSSLCSPVTVMPCPYHASSLTGRDEASRLLSDEATGPDSLFLQPQTLVVGFAPKVLLSICA